jgi:hypothetical protein
VLQYDWRKTTGVKAACENADEIGPRWSLFGGGLTKRSQSYKQFFGIGVFLNLLPNFDFFVFLIFIVKLECL